MKKSFTLIEVVISISILSILVLMLLKILGMSRNASDIIASKIDDKSSIFKIFNLVNSDILNNYSLEIKDYKENSVVILHTRNSIHELFNPYVVYFVMNDYLYRVESPEELKFPIDERKDFFIDKLVKVKFFKVVLSKDKKRILIMLVNDKKYIYKLNLLPKMERKKVYVRENNRSENNTSEANSSSFNSSVSNNLPPPPPIPSN